MRLAVLVAAAAAAGPRPAAASPSVRERDEAGPKRFHGLYLEGWYGKLGLETGVAFGRERGAAPLLGAVATFVRLNEHLEWYGLQGDLLVDWNGDRDAGMRWSFGPELGVAIYGIDLSYFGERTDGETHHGFQARAKLTVGLAAVYVRGAHARGGEDESSLEVGLQLKLPVYIARGRRSLRSAPVAGR